VAWLQQNRAIYSDNFTTTAETVSSNVADKQSTGGSKNNTSSAESSRGEDTWRLTVYAESLYIEESDHNAHVQGQLVISLVGFIFRWDQRLRPKLNLNVHFGLSPKMRLTNFAERKLINYSLFSRRICLFTYRSAKKWSDFRSAKLTGDYTNHIYL